MKYVLHHEHKRGQGNYGWLTTRYSFSFANWYDPTRIGFGALRVINDDQIAPHNGFDSHHHKDMEIITFVMEGTITHKDSLGNTGVVSAGEVQVMSAGTGVTHSEHNDGDETLSLFQMWILPKTVGVDPRYAQKSFGDTAGITLLVGPDGMPDALPIHQDAYISKVIIDKENPVTYDLRDAAHGIYVFVVDGSVVIDGVPLGARDAIGITEAASVEISAPGAATVLIFEVPMGDV